MLKRFHTYEGTINRWLVSFIEIRLLPPDTERESDDRSALRGQHFAHTDIVRYKGSNDTEHATGLGYP
jgi:hypothetical protein